MSLSTDHFERASFCNLQPLARLAIPQPASPPSLHHHLPQAGSCMLGLRPRLKSRPSLLDLVRRESIDQISQRPTLLETDLPLQVPLPSSPVKETPNEAAQDFAIVVSSPSSHSPVEQNLEAKSEENTATKMPPVSSKMAMRGGGVSIGHRQLTRDRNSRRSRRMMSRRVCGLFYFIVVRSGSNII